MSVSILTKQRRYHCTEITHFIFIFMDFMPRVFIGLKEPKVNTQNKKVYNKLGTLRFNEHPRTTKSFFVASEKYFWLWFFSINEEFVKLARRHYYITMSWEPPTTTKTKMYASAKKLNFFRSFLFFIVQKHVMGN